MRLANFSNVIQKWSSNLKNFLHVYFIIKLLKDEPIVEDLFGVVALYHTPLEAIVRISSNPKFQIPLYKTLFKTYKLFEMLLT